MAFNNDTKIEHAFKTFAQDLKSGRDMPVIYMYGAEEYLIDWAANAVASRYIPESARAADFEKPDPDSVSMNDIISSCETFSMFSDKRVVWVKDYPPLYQENVKGAGQEMLKTLESYLESPNDRAVLIFSSSRVTNDPADRREKKTKLNKLLLDKAVCYDFCPLEKPALRAFIEKRIRINMLGIERSVTDYLIDVTGYYHRDTDYRLMNLSSDLDKIVSIAKDMVKREDIDRTVYGDPDTYVFDFLDHISMNRKEDAFTILHNMLSGGSDVFQILGLLTGQFELMLEISELRDSGMDLRAMVKEMGMHEFRVKKALRAAEKFSPEKIRSILCQLYETDTNIKQGNIDGITSLELLIGRI